MILWLLAVPAVSGLLAFAPTLARLRRALLVTAAAAHSALALVLVMR